jgi:drug/metabolite transporter (DMT)-like permease
MSGARFAWLFGVALVFVGFAPVVVFSLGSLLPSAEASAMLGVFPEMSWLSGAESWLAKRRIKWSPSAGLVFALAGLALMYLGATIARWQRGMLDAIKARRRDARRRAHLYGSRFERVEPTLGPADY